MSIDISKRLAVNSIYSLFLESKNKDNITFHNVLQRVNVLLQDRLAYALFEKKEDGKFKFYYPFVNDPIGAKKLAKFYLKEFGNDQSTGRKFKHLESYLYQILDTKYYLLCIQVLPITYRSTIRFKFAQLNRYTPESYREKLEKIRNKPNLNKIKDFEKWVIIYYVLSKVFRNKEEKKKNTGFDSIEENFIGYQESILKSIENLRFKVNQDGNLDRTPLSTKYLDDKNKSKGYWHQDPIFLKHPKLNKLKKNDELAHDFDKKMLDSVYDNEAGAIEVAFKKVRNSLSNLLSGGINDNEFMPLTNFLLFTTRSLYKEEKLRRGCYPYGLKLTLPSSQRKEFESYFKWLNRIGKHKFTGRYKSYQDAFTQERNTGRLNQWIEFFDNDFWNLIGNKSIDESLNILTHNFGEMRSIVDPVFYSNHTHYPFAHEQSGLHRVFDVNEVECDASKLTKLEYIDAMRIVFMYYLMLGMMPDEQKKLFLNIDISEGNNSVEMHDMALSVVPISVRGVSYACIAHYASMGDDIRLKNTNWQRNFNLYHNIDVRFRRSLRQQLEKVYLKNIRVSLIQNIVDVIRGKVLENDYSDLNISNVLNRTINQYSGFMPFELLSVSFSDTFKGIDSIPFFEDDSDNSYYLDIEIKPNPHFLKVFEFSSSLNNRVKEAVESAIKEAFISLNINEETVKNVN